jgi:hypothetical protein
MSLRTTLHRCESLSGIIHSPGSQLMENFRFTVIRFRVGFEVLTAARIRYFFKRLVLLFHSHFWSVVILCRCRPLWTCGFCSCPILAYDFITGSPLSFSPTSLSLTLASSFLLKNVRSEPLNSRFFRSNSAFLFDAPHSDFLPKSRSHLTPTSH